MAKIDREKLESEYLDLQDQLPKHILELVGEVDPNEVVDHFLGFAVEHARDPIQANAELERRIKNALRSGKKEAVRVF